MFRPVCVGLFLLQHIGVVWAICTKSPVFVEREQDVFPRRAADIAVSSSQAFAMLIFAMSSAGGWRSTDICNAMPKSILSRVAKSVSNLHTTSMSLPGSPHSGEVLGAYGIRMIKEKRVRLITLTSPARACKNYESEYPPGEASELDDEVLREGKAASPDVLLPMQHVSRRNAVGSLVGVLASAPAFALELSSPASSTVKLDSMQEAIDLIRAQCDKRWLDGIRAGSGSFVYRGTDGLEAPAVLSEPPDLLDDATYGSAEAAAFFKRLEQSLKSAPVRPSNGHIGVANVKSAAKWGAVASIWPLGETHYAWRRSRSGNGGKANSESL